MLRLQHLLLIVAAVIAIKFLPLLWTIPAALAATYLFLLTPRLTAAVQRHPALCWACRCASGHSRRTARAAGRLLADAIRPRQRIHALPRPRVTVEFVRRAA